jgi:hypothetical protein
MTDMQLASTDTLRNATLNDLVDLLRAQANTAFDVVVNAQALAYEGGLLHLSGGTIDTAKELTVDDIVNPKADETKTADMTFRLTQNCEGQIAEKLGISRKYMGRMRDDAVAELARQQADDSGGRPFEAATLLDHNVNHWLERDPDRKFLLRAFHDPDRADEPGVARAFLSDSFGILDHLDMLTAALGGIKESGVDVTIDRCDLTERNMRVQISAPNVQALAPLWLKGYRSPFDEDGQGGPLQRVTNRARPPRDHSGDPIVYAGLDLRNSETGGGAWEIGPAVIVEWCTNGATMKADAIRAVHLGSKLDMGVVEWSGDTHRKNADLIFAKAKDAVRSFLSLPYLQGIVDRIESKCGAPVKEPTTVVKRISTKFGFNEDEQNSIFAAFTASGQVTAGGVMQAVTAAAQCVEDPDRAAEMQGMAFDVLDHVAAIS